MIVEIVKVKFLLSEEIISIYIRATTVFVYSVIHSSSEAA